jgi:two-component system nitrate/nitrite response regulator NarL
MPPPSSPRRSGAARGAAGLATLTPREREVLARLATGARTRAIATDLGIAEPTVKRHLTNIYRKLGVSNRVEAVTRQLSGRRSRRAV